MKARQTASLSSHMADERLSWLLDRAGRLAALSADLGTVLPSPMREHVRLANIRGDTVVMVADSAAWATQLRYMQHAVLERLREHHEPAVHRFTVKIALPGEPPSTPPSPPARLPESSARHLAALAADETDPSLAAALRRLGERQG